MPRIFLRTEGEDKTITAEKGSKLIDCLRGFHVDAPCGGNNICRKCWVFVNGEAVLSCNYIVQEDIEVRLIQNDNRLKAVGGAEDTGPKFELNPDITVKDLPPPEHDSPLPWIHAISGANCGIETLKK